MPSFFTRQLLNWHEKNPRQLPWTGGPRDPYHIWISEVIMQQTRIEQGAPYYHRFIAQFPDVESLAAAPVDDVLFAWQGLGYYTRARNLHKAAAYIVQLLHGQFPLTYDGLLALPGIGHYSAAAIASFAYGLPFPVVDGNVKRLIARFDGISEPVDLPATHEWIRHRALHYMKDASPAVFNQAIMNFGSLVCKPKNPSCITCPLHLKCYAFHTDQVNVLPTKSKAKANRLRYFHFLVLHHRDKILVEQRDQKDIWNGLFILPYLETSSERKPAAKSIAEKILLDVGHEDFQFHHSSKISSQVLSHQTIMARFHHFKLDVKPTHPGKNQRWVNSPTLGKLAKPKIIVDWIKLGDPALPGSQK
jgi:A/G-specific adenine glycosylase